MRTGRWISQFGFELWDGTTVPRDLAVLCHAPRDQARERDREPPAAAHPGHGRQRLCGGAARSQERHDLRSSPRSVPARRIGRRLKGSASSRRSRPRFSSSARPPTCRAPRPAGGGHRFPRRQAVHQQGQHRLSLRRVERLLPALPRSGDGLYLRVLSSPTGTTTSPAPKRTSST